MAGEKKQALRDECDERGISYTQRDTIKDLEAKLGRRSSSSKATPARARVRTGTRAGSARSTASRSSGSSGGSRPRSAALAKSAPTVRMRVDDREMQPARQPGSADILAVALVVFMCVLAACNTQLDKGRGGPRSHVPVPIVAHA